MDAHNPNNVFAGPNHGISNIIKLANKKMSCVLTFCRAVLLRKNNQFI